MMLPFKVISSNFKVLSFGWFVYKAIDTSKELPGFSLGSFVNKQMVEKTYSGTSL